MDFNEMHRKSVEGKRRGPVFRASFDGGLCSVCDDAILQDDQVLFVDGEITHWECDVDD